MKNIKFVKRKSQIILKDLDQAFSSYARHSAQISTLRGWSITIVVAYVGLCVTKSNLNLSNFSLLPIVFIVICFFFPEIVERALMVFNHDTAREIQGLFSQENEDQFIRKLKAYETMDQKL